MTTRKTTTSTTTLRAFGGSIATKERYLARVRGHIAADQLRQHFGYYAQGSDGKMYMCGVGCTIHDSDHGAYERELGIPRALAYLEDRTFEGLPVERARMWPEQFLAAIPVGADLSRVLPRLMLWLLAEDGYNVGQWADVRGRAAIGVVAGLYRRRLDGDEPATTEWKAAAYTATNAAAYAADATYAAADAAADAAYAAAYAATYAAYAATYAANAAANATYAAADATYAATATNAAAYAAAYAAADAAADAAWERIADQFIALLEQAPVPGAVAS